MDNWEPARGIVYSQIPDSDERDVEMAVTAAKSAFDKWSSMSPEARF
ncbi:aldehyde dehydrogenase family protein [Vibrio parahaemolyticus]